MKTFNNFLEQDENVSISNIGGQNTEKNLLINAGKELFYIALQHPASFRIIFAYRPCERLEAPYCRMSAFLFSARSGVENKRGIEKWIEYSIYRVMQNAISNACLVNIARLGIRNTERMIRSMSIYLARKIFMKRDKILKSARGYENEARKVVMYFAYEIGRDV